jgi:hypothetical protein
MNIGKVIMGGSGDITTIKAALGSFCRKPEEPDPPFSLLQKTVQHAPGWYRRVKCLVARNDMHLKWKCDFHRESIPS